MAHPLNNISQLPSVRTFNGESVSGITISSGGGGGGGGGTGDASEATLAAILAKLPVSLGQKTSAGSLSVVMASNSRLSQTTDSVSVYGSDDGGTTKRLLKTTLDGTLVTSTSGSATEATLSTVSTRLSEISAKLPTTLGQAAAANSLSVVLANDSRLGQATDSIAVFGSDDGGTTKRILKTTLDGTLVTSTSGAATESSLASAAATLSAISAKLPTTLGQSLAANSLSVVLASNSRLGQATDSVSVFGSDDGGTTKRILKTSTDGSLIASVTGGATETTLAALSAKLPTTLGQSLAASSLSVVLASDSRLGQTTDSVSVFGSDDGGTTKRIFKTTLDGALVTSTSGAATETTLATASTTLAAISAKLPTTLGQSLAANSLSVVLANDSRLGQATDSVSVFGSDDGGTTKRILKTSSDGTLVTSGATETTLAALSAKLPTTLGQAASANSLSVVLASDSRLGQATDSVSVFGSDDGGTTKRILKTSSDGTLLTSLSGGATETTLAAVSAKLPTTLGQAAAANSLSVVLASDSRLGQSTDSVSVFGSDDGGTTKRILKTSSDGTLLTSLSGGATETTLAALSAKLPTTLGQATAANSLSVVLANDSRLGQATDSVSVFGSDDGGTTKRILKTSSDGTLVTSGATEATLAAISAKLPTTLGQSLAANSLSVVLASNSRLGQATDSVSVFGSDDGGTTKRILKTSSDGTLVTSLGGGATETTLTTASATLAAISAKLPTTLGQSLAANSLSVVLASNSRLGQATDSVSVFGSDDGGTTKRILKTSSDGTLVTSLGGGATETTLAALSAKLPTTLGQATAANSLSVVLASDSRLGQSTDSVSVFGSDDGGTTKRILKTSSDGTLVTSGATEATLAALSAKLPTTLGQATAANSLSVVLASNSRLGPTTDSVAVFGSDDGGTTKRILKTSSDGTLATSVSGGATEATLAALSAKLPTTLGQATAANSLSVVLASNSRLSQTTDSVLSYGSDDGGTTKRVIKTTSDGSVVVSSGTITTTAESTCDVIYNLTATGAVIETGRSTLQGIYVSNVSTTLPMFLRFYDADTTGLLSTNRTLFSLMVPPLSNVCETFPTDISVIDGLAARVSGATSATLDTSQGYYVDTDTTSIASPIITLLYAEATLTLNIGTWTPAQLSPLMWLDASNAASVTLTSGRVSQWSDISGSARHVTQSTAAQRPIYVSDVFNGLSTVRFRGTSLDFGGEFMTFSDTSVLASKNFYVAIVAARRQVETSTNTFIGSYSPVIGTATGSSTRFECSYLSTSYKMGPFNPYTLTATVPAGVVDVAGDLVPNVDPSVTCAQVGTLGGKLYINGTVVASNTNTFQYSAGLTGLALGRHNDGSERFLTGDIGEIIIISGVPGPTDRARINYYLANKWGLTAQLNSGNPYL